MKEIVKEDKIRLLRFDMGDEVLAGLAAYCQKEGINAGSFTALGACKEVMLSYYDLEKKVYKDRLFTQDMEIVSVVGNIAQLDNKPLVHMHGAFGDSTYKTYSGHVKKLVVSATCEVTLTVFETWVQRKPDKKTGLNLLS